MRRSCAAPAQAGWPVSRSSISFPVRQPRSALLAGLRSRASKDAERAPGPCARSVSAMRSEIERRGRACPARPRLAYSSGKDVDARDKPGHDELREDAGTPPGRCFRSGSAEDVDLVADDRASSILDRRDDGLRLLSDATLDRKLHRHLQPGVAQIVADGCFQLLERGGVPVAVSGIDQPFDLVGGDVVLREIAKAVRRLADAALSLRAMLVLEFLCFLLRRSLGLDLRVHDLGHVVIG